jgi:hypothetical protein
MENQNKITKTNKNRRKFLKLLAFGGVALVATRVFGKKMSALATPLSSRTKSGEKKKVSGEQIDIVENENEVVFMDKKTREEIFILEKN